MRLKVFAAFCLTLLLAAVCLVPGDSARAQRARRRGQQAAPAQSAQAPGPQQDRPKQVIIGRGSDTDRGSRMTITSDNPLNDYSAYRSGDRFYVELPNANADTAARAAGKGFTDLQVQRRGKNVVLSYRVRPGAKPRVEQRFNRLEVVFEVPEGGDARAAQSPQQQAQADAGGGQQGRAAQNQTPTQPAPQPAEQNPSGDRRAQPAPTAAGQSAAAQQPPAPDASAGLAGQSATFGQPAPAEQAPTPIEQSSPIAAEPPAGEVAQGQVPAPAAPVTATTGTAGAAGSGVSIGAYLQRNWMMVVVAALLVLGVGLLIAARRSSASPRTPAEARDREGAAELKEPAAAGLKEPSAPAPGAGAVATAAASMAAAQVAAKESKKAKKAKKGRAAEAAREEKRAAREAKQPAVAADKQTTAETTAVVAPLSLAAEVAAAPEVTPAEPPVVESPVTETPAAAAAPEAPAVAEASVAGEASVVEAAEVLPVAAGLVVAEETRPEAPAEELKAEPVEEVKGVEAFVPAEPEALTKEVAPLDAPDPDRAREETKRLLEGETYDRAAISTRDAMARQMIAAELLSALSGRSPERRERARAAFVEHGYFEEKAEDLRKAEAAAERASAARALGLAGDRAATPHLVGALEDDAVEVRRAAVESLAGLRDPAAVAPLEALLRREKKSKTKVNRKLVEHAVQTCRAGVGEEPLPAVAAALTAATVAEPAVSELAVAEPEEAERAGEAAAVEEVTTETAVEPSAEAAEESAAAEAVEAPSLFVEEPAAEVAPEAEAARAAETTVGPEEEAAAEETLIAEAPADETPTLVAEEETIEVAPPEALEEVSPAAEPSVPVEEREVAVSEETVEVEAAEAASPAGLAGAEPAFEQAAEVREPEAEEARAEDDGLVTALGAAPAAEEVAEVGVEAYEEVAEAGVEVDAGPAVEELPQVEEVPAEEAAAEPALFEEEVAESPSADETLSEEPAPWFVAPSAEAEEEVAAGRGGQAGEWVELDMGELNPVTPTASPEFFAETFETSAAESPVHEHAAIEPLTFEHSAIEPAGREYPAAESAHADSPAAEAPRVDELEVFGAPSAAAPRDAEEKGVALFDEYSSVPAGIQQRLASHEPEERAIAVAELARVDAGDAFHQLCAAFDDESKEVRSAAARALYDMQGDRADTFTRALREATPERRRNIGAAIATSGLASDAISQLTGESREKTYEAFSLLFLMAKAGEVAPLVRAIEGHPNNEVRLAVVKLLALSGQKEILPAFRRLAVRGSLPTEVRSAVMEAIYQISSQSEPTPAA